MTEADPFQIRDDSKLSLSVRCHDVVDRLIRFRGSPALGTTIGAGTRTPYQNHDSATRWSRLLAPLQHMMDDVRQQELLSEHGWAHLFEPRDGRMIVVRHAHFRILMRQCDTVVYQRFDLVHVSTTGASPPRYYGAVRIMIDLTIKSCLDKVHRECTGGKRDLTVSYRPVLFTSLSVTENENTMMSDDAMFESECSLRGLQSVTIPDSSRLFSRFNTSCRWQHLNALRECLGLDEFRCPDVPPFLNMTIRRGLLRSRPELESCLSEDEANASDLPGDLILMYRHWSMSASAMDSGLPTVLHLLVMEYLGPHAVGDAIMTTNEAIECHEDLGRDLEKVPLLRQLDFEVWREYQRFHAAALVAADSVSKPMHDWPTIAKDTHLYSILWKRLECPSVLGRSSLDELAAITYGQPLRTQHLSFNARAIFVTGASAWIPIFQQRLRAWFARPEISAMLSTCPPLDPELVALESRLRFLLYRASSEADAALARYNFIRRDP
jgi:hypothetical protein